MKIENEDELNGIKIIISSEDETKCSVVISDRMFSCLYEMKYSEDLKEIIKDLIDDDTLLIEFIDVELSEAWKESYLQGGISEDRFDRRVIFHQYNDMNEMFCLDEMTTGEIKGNYRGFGDDDLPSWKVGIIKWYRNHLI